MTDLRKAAEMALKFCEDIGDLGGPYPYVNGTAVVSDSRKVLQELRQALAHEALDRMVAENERLGLYVDGPNREWVGLTDDECVAEISDLFDAALMDGNVPNEIVIEYARAIETKLKEKNT